MNYFPIRSHLLHPPVHGETLPEQAVQGNQLQRKRFIACYSCIPLAAGPTRPGVRLRRFSIGHSALLNVGNIFAGMDAS